MVNSRTRTTPACGRFAVARKLGNNEAMTLRAVIFDMDGTLTDSEHWWDEVRRGLAADEGLAWPESSTHAMMGMSTREWSTHMVEVVGVSGTPAEVAERTIAGMNERYRAEHPAVVAPSLARWGDYLRLLSRIRSSRSLLRLASTGFPSSQIA